MYTILEKRVLAENIYLMRIHAPRVARAAKPGQFIIVRIDEFGERVPLTISDYDAEQGSVTIVTQAIGASTRKLCALEQGDALADFVGPLGHPSEVIHEDLDTLRKKRFLFVADVIIGAKTKSMLIYTEEMARVADNLYIATDDGSEGFKGMVTALIKDLIDNRGKQYDVCVAIGPMIMMKFVTLTTKEYSLPTVVSLNTLMVDGTGMCGACRVTVGGKTVFTCVDGPEFDGFQVDFDEAMRRQGMYRTQEERARAIEQERENGHKCRARQITTDPHTTGRFRQTSMERCSASECRRRPQNNESKQLWQIKFRAFPCANKIRKSGPPTSRRCATVIMSRKPRSKRPAA